MKKKVLFTISNKSALRYIAAGLALLAVFFTLFAFVPQYERIPLQDGSYYREFTGYALELQLTSLGSLLFVVMLLSAAALAFLCLSSFINDKPWLAAVCFAAFTLGAYAHVVLTEGISGILRNILTFFNPLHQSVCKVGIITAVSAVLVVLTFSGILKSRLPAMIVLGMAILWALVWVVPLFDGYGAIRESDITTILMCAAMLLLTFSLKQNELTQTDKGETEE